MTEGKRPDLAKYKKKVSAKRTKRGEKKEA